MALYCEQEINLALAEIEKDALENNGGRPLPKYWLPSMRTCLIQSAILNGKKVRELQDKNDELTNQVSTQDRELGELKHNNEDLSSQVKILKEDNLKKDKIITDLQNETTELQQQSDSSSQYNRRDNFKITGVAVETDENLLDVVQSVTRHIGSEINEQDISDLHRLPAKEGSIPGIIVRVNRRRVKHDILSKKKHLRSSPHPQYPGIGIYEDLTPLRSRMLYALRNRKNEDGNKTYKFTWSKEGKLFCRTEEQTKSAGPGHKLPRPSVVNKPKDLLKLGFTEQHVQEIITNKST